MKTSINKIVAMAMQPQFIKAACYFLFIVLVMANHAHAQTISDPGDTDPDVPIDGGLSLLAAAGVGYGAKKMKERNDNKSLNK